MKKIIVAAIALLTIGTAAAAAQEKELDLTEHDKAPAELRFDDGALEADILLRAVTPVEIEAPLSVTYEPPAYED